MASFLTAASLMAPGTSECDLFFLPCVHPAAPERALLGWSEPALAALLSGATRLGRPHLAEVVEHAHGDLVLSSQRDVVQRVVFTQRASSRVLPGGRLLARSYREAACTPADFPSRRAYDSVAAITRARWTLHNRVALHVDCALEEGAAAPVTTVYLRVRNARDVDPVALQRAIERGVADVEHALLS